MHSYPARNSFFAHKFVRLLHKAAVAADIGRDAFSLLVVVAHTEDAMRYRGAAKFWNSQLIETLGFTKWDQFDKARKKAIDAGWLNYSGDGKRVAGEYFVVIPEGYEQISDSPIEESCTLVNPENGYNQGYKEGYKQGIIEGIKRGQSGVQTGDKQGEPSIPIPDPVPNPLPDVFGEMAIPSNLESNELAEIARWVRAMQSDPTFYPGSESLQEKIRRIGILKKDGHDILELVSAAIANSYKMLYVDRGGTAKRKSSGSRYSNDLLATLKVCKSHPGRDAWQEREKLLTPQQIQALKRAGGSAALLEAASNDFNLQTFSELYEAHLKEIRNGITASN